MAETSTKANQKKRKKAFAALRTLKARLARRYRIRFRSNADIDLETLRKVASEADVREYQATLLRAFTEWDKVAQ